MGKSHSVLRVVCALALGALGCTSVTHIETHSESLLDANLEGHQVDWAFDAPGILRAEVADVGSFVLEYGPDGAVLLDADMSQRIALVYGAQPEIWVRLADGEWHVSSLDLDAEVGLSSQSRLREGEGNDALVAQGLGVVMPLFARGFELAHAPSQELAPSEAVGGHQQGIHALAAAAIPGIVDWALDLGGAGAGRRCARMDYQDCVDCCLVAPLVTSPG